MTYDIAIIGAGIAGSSLAAELAPHMRVALLEMEDQPGYHATGRSNALWHGTYGGPGVVPLTLASLEPLQAAGVLTRRPALTLARAGAESAIGEMAESYRGSGVGFELIGAAMLNALIPGLRDGWPLALLEPDCFDIDVAAYHAACLKRLAQAGGDLLCRAALHSARRSSGEWLIETRGGPLRAASLVNAAGAWADEIANFCSVRPPGIQPYRRTLVQLELQKPVDPGLPFILDGEGQFYFRPDTAQRVWLSPHDETPSPPCDAAPEEIDIAVAVDRFEQVVDWPIRRVEHSWAGLRSFAPDRLPIYGEDPTTPSFWWCAGQGGFGVQTAPAAARLCAALILGDKARLPAGVDPARYGPARFT